MAQNKTHEQSTLDEVESHVPETLHPVIEAVFKYQKQVITGVVAIVAVAAIYAGVTGYNQRALASAQAELGSILIQASGQEKIDRLEALLADAPSAARPAVLLELARTTMVNGEYDKGVNYWNQLVGETDEDLEVVARMGKAKCLTLAGKPAEAVTILDDLAGTVNAEYTVPVYRQLAVAAEAAGDTGKALDAYRKLGEQSVSDKPFVDFKIAQLSEK